MGKPLTFSVGIPTFNQAEYLEATIESLLEQTRAPDEIVISDHFSTDGTAAIIDKYVRAGKVRGVRPPEGSNVGGQWQYTLSCLSGEWVTLFSSDDLARPRFCEVLLRGAAQRQDAVLVRAAWENIDEQGQVMSTEYMLSVKAVTEPPETLLEQKHGPKASFAAFAVKREVLVASGGYPLEMESFGDWPMFMQLAPFGVFIYEDEIVSGYRIHRGKKFHHRIGMWLRDEQRMFYEVMPLAGERAGIEDRGWIDEASRTNFLRYLSSASVEFPMEMRGELTPMFAPWAQRVGEEKLLETFAAGGKIASSAGLVERAKNLVRPYVQRVHAGLRRG